MQNAVVRYMSAKACAWFGLLCAPAIASAQNFLLGYNSQQQLPIGPISGIAILSAAADAHQNLYILEGGLGSTCQPVGSPPVGCVLSPTSYLVKWSLASNSIIYQKTVPYTFIAMAVDPAGNIYLAGSSSVEKLGPDGTTVQFNTVIGQAGIEAIALDSAGRIYVTGSAGGQFNTTPGAFQQSAQGSNGFVARLNPDGSIGYATYLGVAVQNPYGIAVDSLGSAFVIWTSQSSSAPTTPGAYRSSGLSQLARLSPDGSSLIYSTYIGGIFNTAYYVAVDSSDEPVVAFDEGGNGWGLAIERFNTQGAGVIWTRYMAGQTFGGLAIDASGNIYAYDSVISGAANYAVKNSLSTCDAANPDALSVFDPNGNLLQGTFVPGSTPVGLALLPGGGVGLFSGPSSLEMTVLTPNPKAQTVQLACMGNGASFYNAGVSPGEIVSLFGSGLGPQAGAGALLDASNRFPTHLANTQVTFNGTPGPLLYAQDGQINAIAPWSLQPGGQTGVCVIYKGATSNCLDVNVAAADPGVFTAGPYIAAAINQDGTYNSAANPAQIGSTVSIYGTGFGALEPLPADGFIVGTPLPVDILPVTMCTISVLNSDCVPNVVTYAGPAPFEVAGVTQINFVTDTSMTNGGFTFITVGSSDNSVTSNPFKVYLMNSE